MATTYNAINFFTGDGETKVFAFSFPYLSKEHVKVTQAGTALVQGTDFSITDEQVTLVLAPATSDVIKIYRKTPTSRAITWSDGNYLLARNMTVDQLQTLYILQEQQDLAKLNNIADDGDGYFDARSKQIKNVADPTTNQDVVTKKYMESVQDGFVTRNTSLLEQTTTQATNAKNNASSSATSASQSASSASASETSNQSAKKWAESTDSPDNQADTDSMTGKTQSSRSWALYSKTKAQESATSATNAKTSESNAKASETKAATSETAAKVFETNAKTSETNAAASKSSAATSATNAKTSETNSKTSETNAANSAKQAAESAGVFQDFKGATADTDGIGGKVPKPLAGQQNKVLKADGAWGDGVTPNTLWNGMHYYPVNYAPSDTSNGGWNRLGFCSITYTERNRINNQPTQYGQLINIPADVGSESTQLWVEQCSGNLYSRGGNASLRLRETQFKKYATLDDVDAQKPVDSKGDNWIRYKSGLQLCWGDVRGAASVSFTQPFKNTPSITCTCLSGSWCYVDNRSTTGFKNRADTTINYIAVGRWR